MLVSVVLGGRVHHAVVADVLMVSTVLLEVRMVDLVGEFTVGVVRLVGPDVLVMDFAFGVSVVEAAVLVSPQELLVGRKHGEGVVLDAVDVVRHFVVRHDVVLQIAGLVVGVGMLIGSRIQMANVWRASRRQVLLCLNCHLGVVSPISGVPVVRVGVGVAAEHLIVVLGGGAAVDLRRSGVDWLSVVGGHLRVGVGDDMGHGVSQGMDLNMQILVHLRQMLGRDHVGSVDVSAMGLSSANLVVAALVSMMHAILSHCVGVVVVGGAVDATIAIAVELWAIACANLMSLVLMLEMASLLLLKDVVVLVSLLDLLALGGLVLVGGLRLNRFDTGGLEALASVELVGLVRLHLEDKVAVADV